ncbi:MAG TPA: hypothetical protein PLH87_07250 [Bacillota bacterium]|nr:hypothetical protein [Bacillota bacterium]
MNTKTAIPTTANKNLVGAAAIFVIPSDCRCLSNDFSRYCLRTGDVNL